MAQVADPDQGCVLATWRLSAHYATDPIALEIGWSTGASWVGWDHASGECVDARVYYDAETVDPRLSQATVGVCLGTVAGECIANGASSWWPKRWTWEVLGCDHPYCEGLVAYHLDRLIVPLPAFEAGERCVVRFAVAWGSPHVEPSPEIQVDDALWRTFRARNV